MTQAYKGYLITKTLSSGFAISIDEKGNRYHIAFAQSIEEAKRTIDDFDPVRSCLRLGIHSGSA